MAWPSNISCDWSTSLKHSQSECSSHEANSRPSDCIAAHYKIVSIKIADKLAIKINIGYMAQLVQCGVHITRKVKSIHAILSHIIIADTLTVHFYRAAWNADAV